MRKIYQFLNLSPAILFLIGFVISVSNVMHGGSHCFHSANFFLHQWEMPAMWLIMFFAHLTPWLLWYQQYFSRNT
jgi:hypothetical protein